MINFIIGFIFEFILATTYNPYYICKSNYTNYDDISECIWILENE
jgi:hypothetical protein